MITFLVIRLYCLQPEHYDNIMEYLKPICNDRKVYFPLRKYALDDLEPEPPGCDLLNKYLVSDTLDNGKYIIRNGGRWG